ncbi:MAG: hypothetical protein MUE98_07055, partial [Rhodobacteraceae bacterium]|nr:hypothetical protein [Paracoccaceae bacterium]
GEVDQSRADYVQIAGHSLVLAAPEGVEPKATGRGFVDWPDVPEDVYILTDIAESRLRALQKVLSSAGRPASTMHEVSGVSALSKLMAAHPLCAILPETLAGVLQGSMALRTFVRSSPPSASLRRGARFLA